MAHEPCRFPPVMRMEVPPEVLTAERELEDLLKLLEGRGEEVLNELSDLFEGAVVDPFELVRQYLDLILREGNRHIKKVVVCDNSAHLHLSFGGGTLLTDNRELPDNVLQASLRPIEAIEERGPALTSTALRIARALVGA